MILKLDNISSSLSDADLKCLFADETDFVRASIQRDHHGFSKGFGYVEFKGQDKNMIINKYSGFKVFGKKLQLSHEP